MVPFLCIAEEIKHADLTYTIRYQDENKKSCLNINVDFKKNAQSQFIIRIPPGIQELKAFPSKTTYQALKEYVYKFSVSPNESLSISYNVCSKNPKRYIASSIIENDFVYLLPSDLLIKPEGSSHQLLNVKFDLSGMPLSFQWLTSFNANKKIFVTTQTIAELDEAVIVGGRLKLKNITVSNQPVYILTKNNLGKLEEEVTDKIKNLITEQRTFWDDFDFPHYGIVLISQDLPIQTIFINGTHKKNLVIMNYANLTKKRLPVLFYALSHELFHTWLGMNLRIPHPQGNLQWFFEGVNDYYGLYFAYRSGAINEASYIKLSNTLLEQYYLSPFKHLPNKDIAKYFRLGTPIAKLIEVRSHLALLNHLALPFDKLKTNAADQDLLDKSVKEIYTKFAQNPKEKLTEQAVNKIFEKHFGSSQWLEIKAYIMEGKYIEPLPELFAKHALLLNRTLSVPDFKFDLNKYLKNQTIPALSPDSNAYKAGLREGQFILADALDFVNPDNVNILLVKEKEQLKEVEFKPNKINKTVPEYNLFNKY